MSVLPAVLTQVPLVPTQDLQMGPSYATSTAASSLSPVLQGQAVWATKTTPSTLAPYSKYSLGHISRLLPGTWDPGPGTWASANAPLLVLPQREDPRVRGRGRRDDHECLACCLSSGTQRCWEPCKASPFPFVLRPLKTDIRFMVL